MFVQDVLICLLSDILVCRIAPYGNEVFPLDEPTESRPYVVIACSTSPGLSELMMACSLLTCVQSMHLHLINLKDMMAGSASMLCEQLLYMPWLTSSLPNPEPAYCSACMAASTCLLIQMYIIPYWFRA
jgi:hypothetical protein